MDLMKMILLPKGKKIHIVNFNANIDYFINGKFNTIKMKKCYEII